MSIYDRLTIKVLFAFMRTINNNVDLLIFVKWGRRYDDYKK